MWGKAALATVALMLLSCFLPLRQGTALQSITTKVSVEPSAVAGLKIGDTFSVNLTVSIVTDLEAWQCRLFYQSAVLNATSYAEGPFLQQGGVAPFFYPVSFTDNYNATDGEVMLTEDRRLANVTGVDGTGVIASIGFLVVGSGSSTLNLDDVMLLDSAQPPNDINFTLVDGWAYAGLVHVTVSKIETPIDIRQGSMAYINVTAENRGGIPETFDVTLLDGNSLIETKTVLNLAAGGTQILNYTWDTTSAPIGEYMLNATTTWVPGETDPSDKNLTVNVYVGTRDLAATSVNPYITSIPGEYPPGGINVSVTVKNKGQATETFNVSLYYVSNFLNNLVATQTTALVSGGSETLTFPWNTSRLTYGNYTLLGSVIPIPYDTNTADKNVTTKVVVTILGDINGDGTVNILDAIILGNAFLSNPYSPNWNPNADINGDNAVNILDAIILSNHFLQHL
jgi:hypothetical protein